MTGVSDGYRQFGVDGYYDLTKDFYENPHAEHVADCLRQWEFLPTDKILDVGCGNGLVTKILMTHGLNNFYGIDKFMAERYKQETGFECLEQSFQNLWYDYNAIAYDFDYAIFSYSYDLIPHTYKSLVLQYVASHCNRIITIRPTNRMIDHKYMNPLKVAKSGKSKMVIYDHGFLTIDARLELAGK